MKKILSPIFFFTLLISLLLLPLMAQASTHTLDATLDLPAMAQGEKQDGDSEIFKDFFTIMYSAKNKIDGSEKSFDDGYTATQRLNFGGKTQPGKDMINSVRFTVNGPSEIKFWWVSGGDGRQFALYDANYNVLQKTDGESVKNSLYISSFRAESAGTYYLGVPDGSNYLFKLDVTEAEATQPMEYVLDATLDLPAMAQGEKQDGDSELFKDFFTIMYSAKNKIDGSEKSFDDGYTATQRLNFGGKTQPGKDMINSVRFTVNGPSEIKFWWVSGGDGRQFALYDANYNVLQKTDGKSVKNSLYISSFRAESAGTYYLGVPDGSNYLFKLAVSSQGQAAEKPPRADWAGIADPVISAAADKKNGTVEATVQARVGHDGGDELILSLTNKEGNEIASRRSIAEKNTHTLTFSPTASGIYTLRPTLLRENEEAKPGKGVSIRFVLPLSTPTITSATSAGDGKISLVWTAVPEATGYAIFCNDAPCLEESGNSCTIQNLTIGETYHFTVQALRDKEKSKLSAPLSAVATEEAQRAWSFVIYGPSTNETDNGYVGNLNEDGQVTVYSENGKGKIQPNADDGIAFYYTAVPANQNFTLRAHVHVDNWDYSNGQEAFGLMAADSVPPMGADTFLTNQYMALASKIEYYWLGGKVAESGTKYSMRLGLGVLAKLGRTADTRDAILGVTYPLETSATFQTEEGISSYNVIGNNTNPDILNKTAKTIQELTDFDLEIQKNNTGYFITYYGKDGSVIGQYKDYNPLALSVLDEENVYVGFFAARRARATFSHVELNVIDPALDAAAEERAVTQVIPSLSITSAATSNSENYTLSCVTNVAGNISIRLDEETIAEKLPAVGMIRNDYPLTLPRRGEMLLEVSFTPDAGQDLGESMVLSSTRTIWAEHTVSYTNAFASLPEIHVAPDGTPSGLGTRERPLSLAAAVQYAQPGQTILLKEGTYSFLAPLRIPQGMDGTNEKPIRMVADPACATRPVLDFGGLSAGIIHGGDYWYFEGFDVTASANGQKGFQVSGHYNTLENICTYHNGNTGIQISRYAGSDPVSEWPSHNLILNCTSFGNADAGYEDADGFAAKLTCGEGNVFDGCVAYHNADDGFDLYAKIETGPIGAVTIQNCVAYSNGFLEDGTNAGNGNGFKLGGSNIPGGHRLINSFAFFNKSKGIDSNSCPDVMVENCVSYNNLRYNVAFYTNIEQDTAYQATGLISFKDAAIPGGDPSEGDEFKPKGKQDPAAYLNESCYYWDGAHAANTKGDTITAASFRSLTFQGISRNADGSINMLGFLELTAP